MRQFLSGKVRLQVSRRLIIAAFSIFSGATVIVGNSGLSANASISRATFFISAPGVEGPPSIPGLTMETFDTLGAGVKSNNASLAIGTVTANSLTVHNCTVGPSCWAGSVTSTSTAFPSDFTLPAVTPNTNYPYQNKTPFAYPDTQVTITLNRAVNYFGFYWAAGSGTNTVTLYSGSTTIASFSTDDLNALIPTSRTASGATVAVNGGGTYNVDHYRGGHKSVWDYWHIDAGVDCRLDDSSAWSVACWNDQQFAYVHAVVPQGITFDKVQLVASDFEFDNLAIANYTGTFDPTGLVGVPLSASTAPTLTPTSYTVTFDANDGSGVTATQTAAGSNPLRTNTFTRAGYTFAGWMTSSTGTTNDYEDEDIFQFTSVKTLYARWAPVPSSSSGTVPAVSDATTAPSTSTIPVTTEVVAQKLPQTGNGSTLLLMLPLGMLVVGVALVARHRYVN